MEIKGYSHSAFCKKLRHASALLLVGVLLSAQVVVADAPQPSAPYPIYSAGSFQNSFEASEWRDSQNDPVVVSSSATGVDDGGQPTLELNLSRYGTANLTSSAQFASDDYAAVTFRIYGSMAGGPLQAPFSFSALSNGYTVAGTPQRIVPAAGWQSVSLPMSAFGLTSGTSLVGFQFRDGDAQTNVTDNAPVYLNAFTLEPDLNPPAVASVSITDLAHVVVRFTKKVSSASATATANYSLSSVTDSAYSAPVSPLSAALGSDPAEVTLNFSPPLVSGDAYALATSGLTDRMQPPQAIAAGTSTDFTATYLPTNISIDAAADTHPISPDIYGLAFAPSSTVSDLNFTVGRQGGNAEGSTYNWQADASNRSSDYFYESLPEDSGTAAVPALDADNFVQSNQTAGSSTLMSVPTNGWVAKLGPSQSALWSYSSAKYGTQTATDGYKPDAGSGVLQSTGTPILTNDPNDAQTPSTPQFQKDFVQHLVNSWGMAAGGGVRYFAMDNEPDLWSSTHQDTHPVGTKNSDVLGEIEQYGAMVKSVDPTAQAVGPEVSGFTGYFYSGYDNAWATAHGWGGPLPDRTSIGDADSMPWLLGQLHQNDLATGTRSLDVFSLHYYPQSGEYGSDVSQAMQLLRNRSTRSLWDPAYVDESWIGSTGTNGGIVKLIPQMKEWVNANYPGTKTGITEYNWGAEGSINGATTEADILGIFGRERLDLATYWAYPTTGSYTYNAMKLYRNYDGNKSAFGDVSLADSVPNPDDVSSFASRRSSDGALTVIVDNKQLSTDSSISLNLSHFLGSGTAQAYRLSSTNAITRLSDIAYSGNSLQDVAPRQSVTLYVLPPAANSGSVCLKIRVSGRSAAAQRLSGLSLGLLPQSGTAALVSLGGLTSQADGTVLVTDPTFVAQISDSSSYRMQIAANGYLSQTVGPFSGLLSQCAALTSAQAMLPGDFSLRGNSTLKLQDLVTSIRAINFGTDPASTTVDAMLGRRPDIAFLVTMIRQYDQQ